MVIMVMGLLVEYNACFTAFSIFSMDHNQGVFQLTKEAIYIMSKQVKKHMHTVITLACSPEFDV
jgi:hypothetical protein